jgi:hypothetical protein
MIAAAYDNAVGLVVSAVLLVLFVVVLVVPERF